MQFQVPQFTETDTKLIGPLTLKEFLWLASGAVLLYLMSFFLKGTFLLIALIVVAPTSAALAFIKVQNTSLARYVSYMILYFLKIERYTYKPYKGPSYLPEEKHHITY